MEPIISCLQTALANLLLFSAIPFIYWIFRDRKNISFADSVGLFKPKLESKVIVFILFLICYFAYYNFDFTNYLPQEDINLISSSTSISSNSYNEFSVAIFMSIIIRNFISNGLAEEIFFRGFICKKTCARFGFIVGNIIHALLFAIMHNLLYVLVGVEVSSMYHVLMFIYTSIGAFSLGLLNEKLFNKSTIPSVIIHGIGNFISNIMNVL